MTIQTDLSRQIEEEFFNDERLCSQHISVHVDGHQVKLSGTVKSFREKLLASEIASSYAEVRDVQNQLNVQPMARVTDQEIELNIRNTLEASADVTAETIKISSHHGKVTLSGYVSSYWERTIAGDLAQGVVGVQSIENLLLVNLMEKIGDEELCYAIKAAISRTHGLSGDSLKVAVCDGVVELNGIVDQLWKKELVESIVRRFNILHIDNDIIIQ